MKKPLRRLLWIFGILAGILLLSSVLVQLWIDHRLPRLLQRENDTGYAIRYATLDVALWSGTVTADSVDVRPYREKMDSVKVGLFATVPRIEIRGVSLWSLLFSDRIRARSIGIRQPQVLLYRNATWKKDFTDAFVKPFGQILSVGALDITDGNFQYFKEGQAKPIAEAVAFSLNLDGITLSEHTLQAPIPFRYERYRFTAARLYHKSSPNYHMATSEVTFTDRSASITGLRMLPDVTKAQYLAGLSVEKDFYHLKADTIAMDGLRWGFRDTVPFVHVPLLRIVEADAHIYRSKLIPDDQTKKKLYNRLLRELDIDLRIDTLDLRRSRIVYEEEVDAGRGPGVLTFSDFNLRATHIASALGRSKMPDVRIRINTRFMKESRLAVDWSFNVLDKSDGFLIKGRLLDFDARKLDPFTKPYSNMKTRGKLDEVYFTVKGNDIESRGEVALRYDDLKVKLYRKKKPEKENKLMTAVGNLLAKNDTKGKVEAVPVRVKRKQNASFYNFLWRNIEDGLKGIIL